MLREEHADPATINANLEHRQILGGSFVKIKYSTFFLQKMPLPLYLHLDLQQTQPKGR
jgi:hypothetical protein